MFSASPLPRSRSYVLHSHYHYYSHPKNLKTSSLSSPPSSKNIRQKKSGHVFVVHEDNDDEEDHEILNE